MCINCADIKILQQRLQDTFISQLPPIADISFNNYAGIFDVIAIKQFIKHSKARVIHSIDSITINTYFCIPALHAWDIQYV